MFARERRERCGTRNHDGVEHCDARLRQLGEHACAARLGERPSHGARFAGQELQWDRAKLEFTNHAEATRTIVKRDYRKGFEPVRM